MNLEVISYVRKDYFNYVRHVRHVDLKIYLEL